MFIYAGSNFQVYMLKSIYHYYYLHSDMVIHVMN